MSTLSPHDPRGRFMLSAIARIADQVDPDASVTLVLVGTVTADREEIHYYVTDREPDVQRVMILGDTTEAAEARELLAAASVRLTAPRTP